VPRIVVPDGHRAERVDRVLVELNSGLSRATIQRWIQENRVLVDGQPCRSKDRVRGGAVIEFEPGPPPASRAEPDGSIVFGVVFEDEQLIVVDKPAGLVVHPGRGNPDRTLVNGLLARVDFGRPPSDERDPEGPLRPGVVHRIDKDTSGLLVVAKTEPAREGLKCQFAAHSIDRSYVALTCGVPQSGRIETAHGRHPQQRLRFTCNLDFGKRAVTNIHLEERFNGPGARVSCSLESGRTHQIRVHLSEYCRTPILGDRLYGGVPTNLPLAPIAAALGRQALHAAVLGFDHPTTGRRLRFESELPADMLRALEALRELGPANG
jgi:23S rRNA pseudouridine1911/1915/1917 synthase